MVWRLLECPRRTVEGDTFVLCWVGWIGGSWIGSQADSGNGICVDEVQGEDRGQVCTKEKLELWALKAGYGGRIRSSRSLQKSTAATCQEQLFSLILVEGARCLSV